MTLGERIRAAREYAGLSQPKVASRVSVSRSTVSQWESNKIVPGYNRMRALADACGVSGPWLIFETGRMTASDPDLHMVPMLDWDDADDYARAGMPDEPPVRLYLDSAESVGKHAFALTLHGDSQTSEAMPEGAAIIVDPDARPADGRWVVVREGDSPAVLKRIIQDGNRRYLMSVDDRLPLRAFDDSWRVLGVVRRLRLDRRLDS